MDLLIGTLVLRPYVFGFLVAFLVAGAIDVGWRRTLLFGAWVGPLAWLCEFSSTRTGIPFGLYHYTGSTRGQELFIADVPFMDSLSFTFLAYAAFCLARGALRARQPPAPVVVFLAGVLMMLLDVVIDPLAVRGDRWFLGRIFYYPDGGAYFGVPLSNFLGWMVVGWAGVGGYLLWSEWGRRAAGPTALRSVGGEEATDRYGTRVWPGIGLYYAVLAFNLVLTGWIGEWVLLGLGAGLHAVAGLGLWSLRQRPAPRLGLEKQRA
jgi:putative membrane protein